ncbi:DNA-binding protein [Chamaesiphon sp. VAR_48_metabat_135_sub]|uniref:helix-turn-helix transcriptional regulator n=1 Tax=Chamaesiphon sp. VAR_48_metabat_135_sub TaxID=2964699 RepID=UPI002869FB9C|nr:DNA-binding protein [Chamaesiphon sp. VAR_48_metabat_135_sub]
MKEYSFTLKFNFPDARIDPDHYIEQLYESGCDDALIGIGKQGYIALEFIRSAASAFDAVSTAIVDVKKVIPNASLIEATPDFVGLTDTAKILGCTRQNIRNLIFNDDTRSPSPVYEGTPSIWHLAEILTWLREAKTYSIDDSLLEVAIVNMEFNIARKWRNVEPDLQENIRALVC